jgi:hypothetical protein
LHRRSAARPKKHGLAPRRPRPMRARGPCLSPSRANAGRRDPCRRRPMSLAAVPVPSQHPSAPPSTPPPPPAPLACDFQLASAAVSAARRDSASSHPRVEHTLAYQGGPVRLRPPHRSPPALPHVRNSICTPTAASRFSMGCRSAISSAPRFAMLGASKERRFEAGPAHLPELTKGQRLEAPDLLKPPLPRPLTHGHTYGHSFDCPGLKALCTTPCYPQVGCLASHFASAMRAAGVEPQPPGADKPLHSRGSAIYRTHQGNGV